MNKSPLLNFGIVMFQTKAFNTYSVLKSVSILVVQSSYDRSVKTTEEDLYNFKESGKDGVVFVKEINDS